MINKETAPKNKIQKTTSIVLLIFFSLIFLLLVTGLFAGLSKFLYGIFGLAIFGLLIAGILTCVFNLLGKKITIKRRYIVNFVLMYLFVVLLVHAITSTVFITENTDFSSYIADCYNYSGNRYSSATFGGVLSGMVIYPIYNTLTGWGLYVILIIGLLVTVFVATNFFMKYYSDSRESVFFDATPSVKKEKKEKSKPAISALKFKTEDIISDKVSVDIPKTSSINFANFNSEKPVANDSVPLKDNRVTEPNKNSAYDILYGDITSMNIEPQNDSPQQSAKPAFDTSPTFKDLSRPTVAPLQNTKTDVNNEPNTQPLTYSQSSPHTVRANPVAGKYNTTPIINAEYLALQKQLEREKRETPKVETIVSPSISASAVDTHEETVSDVFMEVDTSSILANDLPINSMRPAKEEKPKYVESSNQFVEMHNENPDDIFAGSKVQNPPESFAQSNRSGIISSLSDMDKSEVLVEEIKQEETAWSPSANSFNNSDNIVENKNKVVGVEPVNIKEKEDGQLPDLDDSESAETPSNLPVTKKFNDSEKDECKIQDDEDELIVYPPYNAPDLNLLLPNSMVISVSEEECRRNSERIEATLEEFKIPVKVVSYLPGPTVTRYELSVGPGISVNRLPALANDIAVRLAVAEVRWEIPIPGKELVGLEVPNKTPSKVPIREIIASKEFRNADGELSFAIGIDLNCKKIISDIAAMPHMLVAGGSGSGKSVALNALIISLLYKYSPEQLRLVLIDPKLVEFVSYDNLPHLMVNEIISDTEKIVSTFKWLVTEMERRYKVLRSAGVVDIATYNRVIDSRKVQRMPRIVVIVDELADIMSTSAKPEVEASIMRLAQKARAAGIHLVLATQRPSVQVVSGNIKNNFGYRMALKVASNVDSKTVLDTAGAEKLVGKGDMLFKMETKPDPVRLQGAYIDRTEVTAVVEYIKQNNSCHFSKSVQNRILKGPEANFVGGIDVDAMENDPEFINALKVCLDKKRASTTLLQTFLRIGWNKAVRIMEAFEALGYVSAQDASKSRQLLISREEFDKKYGGRF